MAVGALVGCGGDDDASAAREQQIREAGEEAGLDEEIIDVLVLAARGTTASFQVSYPGTGGASVVVSQDPPNRRVDVLSEGLVVESQVVRGEVAYRCDLRSGGRPGDDLECVRTQGALAIPGAFNSAALAQFVDELVQSHDDYVLTVTDRRIAGVEARCLTASPRAAPDSTAPEAGGDSVCLSPDGAQLLVDVGGERVVADAYTERVPEGTFDI